MFFTYCHTLFDWKKLLCVVVVHGDSDEVICMDKVVNLVKWNFVVVPAQKKVVLAPMRARDALKIGD